MSSIAKYRGLIKDHLAPFLKAEGFTAGSSSFYYRHNDLLLRALTFDADQFNLTNRYSFHIVLHFIGLTNLLHKPKTVAEVVQKGNIPVMSVPMGEWARRQPVSYTIVETTDIPELAQTIKADLQTGGLPILHNTASVSALQSLLEAIEKQVGYAKFSFSLAIFLAVIGDKEQSRLYFLKSGGDKAVITKTAAAYGIDLSLDKTNEP